MSQPDISQLLDHPGTSTSSNVIPHEKYPLGRALTRAALRRSHAYIAQSDQVRRDLDEVVPGVDPATVITTPHPVYDFTPPGTPRPTRASTA